jgi:dienelactone hydrolase
VRRSNRGRLGLLAILLMAGVARAAAADEAAPRFAGPWDLDRLGQAPTATWGATSGLVQEVYYPGEPLAGKPTRIFAYYARPAAAEGPLPAMLLVHGGGGQAFSEWATLWAERGYAALAMDLAGQGPDRERLPDGGPDQSDDVKFRPFEESDVPQMWTYHAVAAVLLGHSLLADQPEVDRERIGITGISWGGYLTSIVAGIDPRLKVAVPVYGCGFLAENSVWLPRFAALPAEDRARWTAHFDPARYLPGVSCPILFVNGTNDFAYPLDSYRKSYRLVPGRADLSVTVGLPHGHREGWAPREIGLFVDSVLRGGDPLPRMGPTSVEGDRLSATFESKTKVAAGGLHFTTSTGEWQTRAWQSVEAELADGTVGAALPAERPLVAFLTVTDERGAVVSTEHVELAP